MRMLRIVAVLALLGITCASAQDTNAPVAVSAAEPVAEAGVEHAAKLVVDQAEFDFGTLDSSQTAEHTYVLRNDGDLTLEISQVRPSCGCTVASITERSVPPGGESRVTARLALAGRSGPQRKSIIVESNDPKQPQFTLMLSGVAGTAIDVQPQRVVLGQVAAGSHPTASVALTGSGSKPYHITSVDVNNDKLSTAFSTTEDGRVYKVDIATKDPMDPGQLDAVVTVHTDHPDRPTIEVPVTFLAVGEVVVAPREIVFPAASTDSVTRYVILRSANGNPMEVSGVETPDPSITAVVEPFGPSGFKIQLNNLVPIASLDGKMFRIHTSVPGSEIIDVPLRVPQTVPGA